jgi:hypothetical protein
MRRYGQVQFRVKECSTAHRLRHAAWIAWNDLGSPVLAKVVFLEAVVVEVSVMMQEENVLSAGQQWNPVDGRPCWSASVHSDFIGRQGDSHGESVSVCDFDLATVPISGKRFRIDGLRSREFVMQSFSHDFQHAGNN